MGDVRMLGEAALEAVAGRVGRWPGVTSHPHLAGGVEFRVGQSGIGHLHALAGRECVADLPFPPAEHDALIASGRAREHGAVPGSGWVSAPVRTPGDVSAVVELFARTYERAMSARMRPGGPAPVATRVGTRDVTDSPRVGAP